MMPSGHGFSRRYPKERKASPFRAGLKATTRTESSAAPGQKGNTMEDRKQSVIPNSTCDVDAAAYAVGRKHNGMPPAKLGAPKGMGLGRRGADQPKEHTKYKTYKG
jgi:hypothetical protein